MEQEILNGYHNEQDNNWAYGSIKTVNAAFPQLSRKQVKNVLHKMDVYTRFYPYRKSKLFTPYYVRGKRQLLQSDICYMGQQYADQNDGYIKLLVVIDVFTKYVWLRKMKSIEAEFMVKAFEDIIKQMKDKPIAIQTDKGKEFDNQHMKQLFNKYQIKHYYATSDRKAAVAERVNLTLQQKLYKMMISKKTNRWIDLLPGVLKLYHNSRHRTIKMTPNEAEKDENQNRLREIHEIKWKTGKEYAKKKITPKFKVGDKVRIAPSNLQKFRRGYHPPWSIPYYFIHKVLTNMKIPRYKLLEYGETEPMNESWFEDELVLFDAQDDQEWDIENWDPEQTRGSGNRKEILVKFYGWPKWEYVKLSSVHHLLKDSSPTHPPAKPPPAKRKPAPRKKGRKTLYNKSGKKKKN